MHSNDAVIKAFYIKYCKILNKVIEEAKKQHYNRLTAKSDNKIKTAWNIKKTGDWENTHNRADALSSNKRKNKRFR
jgi:hypothetical protein